MNSYLRQLALAVLLTIGPAAATAQDFTLPSKPDPRQVVRAHSVPRGFIAMWATTVVRYSDGQFLVLYGFIFGNMKRDSIAYSANDLTGIQCEGETARQPDGSGLGEMRCSEAGKIVSVSPIAIAKGVYGKLNGIDSGVVLDPIGDQIGTSITQWNAMDFPDAEALVKMFNQ